MDKRINSAGLQIVKESEGLRLKTYRCPAGVKTIGYGHTKNVQVGQVITEEEANAFLLEDIKWAESAVNTMVRVPLTDNQFSALVSLVFNIGSGAFKNSTLLKLLNQSQYKAAANQILRWDRAAGEVLKGLTTRRAKEHALYMSK